MGNGAELEPVPVAEQPTTRGCGGRSLSQGSTGTQRAGPGQPSGEGRATWGDVAPVGSGGLSGCTMAGTGLQEGT